MHRHLRYVVLKTDSMYRFLALTDQAETIVKNFPEAGIYVDIGANVDKQTLIEIIVLLYHLELSFYPNSIVNRLVLRKHCSLHNVLNRNLPNLVLLVFPLPLLVATICRIIGIETLANFENKRK